MYKWNQRPLLIKHVRGSLRVFHSAHSCCLKTRNAETGDKPPRGYWPCYRCFPWGTRRASQALEDVR